MAAPGAPERCQRSLIYSILRLVLENWFTASNVGLDLSRAAAAFGEAAAVEISSCDAGCIPTAAANFKAGLPKTAGAVQMAQQLHNALHVPDGRMNKMLWRSRTARSLETDPVF